MSDRFHRTQKSMNEDELLLSETFRTTPAQQNYLKRIKTYLLKQEFSHPFYTAAIRRRSLPLIMRSTFVT